MNDSIETMVRNRLLEYWELGSYPFPTVIVVTLRER